MSDRRRSGLPSRQRARRGHGLLLAARPGLANL